MFFFFFFFCCCFFFVTECVAILILSCKIQILVFHTYCDLDFNVSTYKCIEKPIWSCSEKVNSHLNLPFEQTWFDIYQYSVLKHSLLWKRRFCYFCLLTLYVLTLKLNLNLSWWYSEWHSFNKKCTREICTLIFNVYGHLTSMIF